MNNYRVYFRVPRRERIAGGVSLNLTVLNSYIDVYNGMDDKFDFWAFLSGCIGVRVFGFDMVRNIGNPAMKYVHIIKLKGSETDV